MLACSQRLQEALDEPMLALPNSLPALVDDEGGGGF